jgi:hypothetical protein
VFANAWLLEPGRGMGLLTRTMVVMLLAAAPRAVLAQDYAAPPPPIAPQDMINYCIYGGLIYSVGSQLCVVRGGPPLYCDQPAAPQGSTAPRPRAMWTTSQPPATINCANDPIGAIRR